MPAVASQLSTHFTGPKKNVEERGGKNTSATPDTQNLPWFVQGFTKSLKAKWIFNLNPKSGLC